MLSVYNRTYVRALTPLAGTWVSNGSSGREASRWRVAGGRVSHSGTALGFYYCVALLVLPAARHLLPAACRPNPRQQAQAASGQPRTPGRDGCVAARRPPGGGQPRRLSRDRGGRCPAGPRRDHAARRRRAAHRRELPRALHGCVALGAAGRLCRVLRSPLLRAAELSPPHVRRLRACPRRPAASPRRLTCSGGSDAASRAQHAGADSNTDSGGGAAVRCGGALAQGRRDTATRARRSTASSPASCARVETSRRGTAPAAGSEYLMIRTGSVTEIPLRFCSHRGLTPPRPRPRTPARSTAASSATRTLCSATPARGCFR
jgi:hypothetical protein